MPFFQEATYCVVPQPLLLGDERCHNVGKYNTAVCSFDGGDCEEFNARYPACEAEYPFQLGDGICQIQNNVTECNFDGEDCLSFAQRFPDCKVDDTSLLGDGICNGGMYNTAECGFDDKDCMGFNLKFPDCKVDDPIRIGNGKCNRGEYNTPECNYDNGDCIEFNEKYPECLRDEETIYKGLRCKLDHEGFDDISKAILKLRKPSCEIGDNCTEWLVERYPNCDVAFPPFIGDGICHGNAFSGNTPECGYEGGDCLEFSKYFPNCTLSTIEAYRIGDGSCDGGEYNTVECGFDGGDCVEFNTKFPNCTIDSPDMIGDGRCDGGIYNTPECGYDGGDCDVFNKYPDCEVNNPFYIGDGHCQQSIGNYNTPECGFDGGDCDAINSNYAGCHVPRLWLLDNGECQGNYYNTPECNFDGGDCLEFNRKYPDCKVGWPKYVGDKLCDRRSYNIPECGFDGGDCLLFNIMYPYCKVDNPSLVGDGTCNGGLYNTNECGFDGGDCLVCSSDNEHCQNEDAVLFINGEKVDTQKMKKESMIISTIQMVSSSISLVASIIVLWMISRSREKLSTIFHRLLLMLCVTDILSSIALSLSTLAIPIEYKDVIWNAQGNKATCQAQGFIIFIGSMAAPLYNCSLCLYYLFVVKFQMKDIYIKKKVEPFLHGIPIMFSLVGATTILANGAFNVNMSFCFIGVDPTCDGADCISPSNAKLLFIIFSAAPYIILPVVITVSMLVMFRVVSRQENTRSKYGSTVLRANIEDDVPRTERLETTTSGRIGKMISNVKGSKINVLASRSRSSKMKGMSRLIVNRALAYSLGYIFTYTIPMVISIKTLLNKETGFTLSILGRILFPLQGFFNFLIFCYPKVLKKKKSNGNISLFGAFVKTVYSQKSSSRRSGTQGSKQGNRPSV